MTCIVLVSPYTLLVCPYYILPCMRAHVFTRPSAEQKCFRMTWAYFYSTARSNVRLRNVRIESPFHRRVMLSELAGWNGLYI